jgi:hypothetical protein
MSWGTPRSLWILLALLGAAAFFVALAGCLPAFPSGPTPTGDPQRATPGGGTDGGTGAASDDPAVQHCVSTINSYRSQAGVPPIQLSSTLSMFSQAASEALAAGGAPHQYFIDASNSGTLFSSGFCGGAAENQAPGWQVTGSLNDTIDAVLQAMMAEGPGGGHHDNIVSAGNALVGVGLVVANGSLYFTNDFSPPCH